ncbi:MAG TPA: bifunctional phosphopantothenoylcysteine decarboxylase/phosphopantothenate--cysteine ligase CoaBC [Gammaproteobacteria bacterium]|nr:bifunctional phosphopantothenoylcysteine decarboxylase/phosphopantothenate--cysteine ligase CoaBC [Gammaproteobacteria bacterium]
MTLSTNKRILLGISGGIAAYKSPDIVRRLRERGFEVRVAMTRAACEFVTPLTLQAVSGVPVHTRLLDASAEAAMGHIELARWADTVLIAPASADCLAKLAHGIADDLLSTLCLATAAPIVLAPAMNRQMWEARATQENVAVLKARGLALLGPGDGSQACGEVGPGRMLEPADISDMIAARYNSDKLRGLSVMVTAGATREALDPVRFISNQSSGKMGYAVADAAAEAGARVVLVSGPTSLEAPYGVERVCVTSAGEMYDAVMRRIRDSQIFIGAAAVSDYAPKDYAEQKLKKSKDSMTISLVKTRDILAEVAALEHAPFTVGFAAETNNVEGYARDKLSRKSLDMIAANRVGVTGSGFGSDENALSVYWSDGAEELELAPKLHLARRLIGIVADRYREKHPAQNS